jgi:hypothetical protein
LIFGFPFSEVLATATAVLGNVVGYLVDGGMVNGVFLAAENVYCFYLHFVQKVVMNSSISPNQSISISQFQSINPIQSINQSMYP